MPDALSKTVPIWCAVLNNALFPHDTAYHNVQFPPSLLSASEESQIRSRINKFVASFEVRETCPARYLPYLAYDAANALLRR